MCGIEFFDCYNFFLSVNSKRYEVYLKSAGSYVNAKDSEKDHLVCDENGFDETKLLPYGIYIVHQTKGWENTEWMQDFEVVISENEKNYFYLINDAVLKSFVRIVKKDAETGKTICASGIGFKVWDCANKCYVEQTVNYPTQITIDTFCTDESGTLMLPCELVYGNYELHEVQTANGYVLDKTPVGMIFPTVSNMYVPLFYHHHTDMFLILYIRSLHTSDTIPMFRFSACTVFRKNEADH